MIVRGGVSSWDERAFGVIINLHGYISAFSWYQKQLPGRDMESKALEEICLPAMPRESTVVASRCAKVVAGAGSVRSSAGT